MTCDPRELADNATCFNSCIPAGMAQSLRTYLLCQLENVSTCDPDAQAFIDFIQLQDPVKQDAICQLVSDLKNTAPATTPASSFWSRDVLIYPMVADAPSYPLAQQGVNLRNPGTNTLLQSALPPLYTARGIQGVKASSTFLNTQYVIPVASQDNLRIMWYMDVDSSAVNDMYFGCQNTVANVRTAGICVVGLGRPFSYDINMTPVVLSPPNGASPLGAYFCEAIPTDVTHGYAAYGNAVTWSQSVGARVSKAPPAQSLYLFANNANTGVSLFSSCRLSGFSLGSLLSDAERLQYKAIWDKFETALGRAH